MIAVGSSTMAPKRKGEPHAKRGAAGHRFGGDWTTEKLEVLKKYLESYTRALRDQPSKARPFVKGYIDAFAGTGSREAREDEGTAGAGEQALFPELAEPAPRALLDGSARLALKTEPRFDKYIFIERDAKRCAELEGLKLEFPHLADDIDVRPGDANVEIQDLCKKNWKSRRAVLFLDPYGMHVEWATVEAIAGTKAIDLWLLFPLGIGVNRLLTRSGEIPESWRHRLDLLLGTQEWYDEFYRVEHQPTLFGETERVVKATTETIGRYFNERLASVFFAVAKQPRVLRNSSKNPLYLLCFAVGNEKGARVALRIAEHLLTKGSK
jgi:three-Cys-motif partner protein